MLLAVLTRTLLKGGGWGLKNRVRGKGNEAEVRKSKLEPKYGSYGFTPSGLPFVIATSRPVGYSPGGAPRKGGGRRKAGGREGGIGEGEGGWPPGTGPRLLHISQLRSSQRPSSPGTQLKDIRRTGRPGRPPRVAMAPRSRLLNPLLVFDSLFAHHTRMPWVSMGASKRI